MKQFCVLFVFWSLSLSDIHTHILRLWNRKKTDMTTWGAFPGHGKIPVQLPSAIFPSAAYSYLVRRVIIAFSPRTAAGLKEITRWTDFSPDPLLSASASWKAFRAGGLDDIQRRGAVKKNRRWMTEPLKAQTHVAWNEVQIETVAEMVEMNRRCKLQCVLPTMSLTKIVGLLYILALRWWTRMVNVLSGSLWSI